MNKSTDVKQIPCGHVNYVTVEQYRFYFSFKWEHYRERKSICSILENSLTSKSSGQPKIDPLSLTKEAKIMYYMKYRRINTLN